MPRKTCVNAAQAENLHKWQKQAPSMMVEDAEDSEFMDLHPCPPSSHARPNPHADRMTSPVTWSFLTLLVRLEGLQ